MATLQETYSEALSVQLLSYGQRDISVFFLQAS